jgi:hypothetical protein
MKKTVVTLWVFIFLGSAGMGFSGETGHYVCGVEGIKCGSLPPPGVYFKLYNALYTSDELTDKNGDEAPLSFDVTIFAPVSRFIWVTDQKFLGGSFFMDTTIPLLYTDISIEETGVSDTRFGLGDINVEPFGLAWHGRCYDLAAALSLWMTTGAYDASEAASPGKDFWTPMITAGGTYYLDSDKTWAMSILMRYEIHSKKRHSDVTPGDDFLFEWGVSKTLAKIWDVGLTGYCSWQVEDDSGADVTWEKDVHDKAFAVGPEISVFLPPIATGISMRLQWEIETQDRPRGIMATLTFTREL